jgi:hypothetical protein
MSRAWRKLIAETATLLKKQANRFDNRGSIYIELLEVRPWLQGVPRDGQLPALS